MLDQTDPVFGFLGGRLYTVNSILSFIQDKLKPRINKKYQNRHGKLPTQVNINLFNNHQRRICMGIADIIRAEFNKGNELTLGDLHKVLLKHPEITIEHSKLGHRIRSTIYSLNKSNEIVRIGKSTYKKVNNK